MNKRERAQQMGYSARIRSGGRWYVFTEMLIMFAAHTALTIATGYFLWNYEFDIRGTCLACN